LAGIVYLSVTSARERGIAGTFHWVADILSLRSGHRFLGTLNWILLLALLSNIATGFFILGTVPLLSFPRLPLHAYGMENWARLAHDTGTAFIVASFSGQIYLRLLHGINGCSRPCSAATRRGPDRGCDQGGPVRAGRVHG
jgi:hypothetical protein